MARKKSKAKKSTAKKAKTKKVKKTARKVAAKRTKAPARKAAARKSVKKSSKKKAVKKAPKKAARKAPARKAKNVAGEGSYTASRNFRKKEEAFVKKNKARIPEMAKEAEAALEGPQGAELEAAEAEASEHGVGME